MGVTATIGGLASQKGLWKGSGACGPQAMALSGADVVQMRSLRLAAQGGWVSRDQCG